MKKIVVAFAFLLASLGAATVLAAPAMAAPAGGNSYTSDYHTSGWYTVSYLGPWGGNWNTEQSVSSWHVTHIGPAVYYGWSVDLVNEVCQRVHYQIGPVSYHKLLFCSTTSQRITPVDNIVRMSSVS